MKLRSPNSVMVRDYHALPDDLCDALIKLFEHDVKNHERVENDSKPCFTQLNLNQHHGKIIPTLYQYFTEALDLYREEVSAAKYLPKVNFMEEFRIKRYEVGGVDRFDEHIDVSDFESARRYLAALFYLNDVEEGGHTVFPFQDKSVHPKKGHVIFFPPTWEYPHAGEPPVSNSKYIMSTYLHYE